MADSSGKLDRNWTTSEWEKEKRFDKWFMRVWWAILIAGTIIFAVALRNHGII